MTETLLAKAEQNNLGFTALTIEFHALSEREVKVLIHKCGKTEEQETYELAEPLVNGKLTENSWEQLTKLCDDNHRSWSRPYLFLTDPPLQRI